MPIVEAGDLLGFVTVNEGDLLLTSLGRAYADATILARKAIVAGRVLRLPIIAWIYETLQHDDNQRVAWSFFHDTLEKDFGDKAEEQLDIAINWGRQAELFAYDDDAGELYLETSQENTAEKSFVLAELYEAWPVLSERERVEGFRLLQQKDAEDFFMHLSAYDKAQLIVSLLAGERKTWVRLLAADEAAEVIHEASEEQREVLLSLLDDKTRREVKGFLDYQEEQTKGPIKLPYARLRPDMTVDEAISYLRRDARDRAETAYYAYVTDSDERLLGTVAFRDLLITPGDKTVADVLRTDVVTADETSDPEVLHQLFARYNLQMIPLVDREKHIKRVVTRDDVAAAGATAN